MASTINTNIQSLTAQRNLSNSQTAMATSMARLSSGLRINSAKDDAAGLARAHHHGVFLGDLALIAVVLLVDAVELDELLVVAAEAIGFRVGEGFANGAGKVGFVRLQEFVLCQGLAGDRVHDLILDKMG